MPFLLPNGIAKRLNARLGARKLLVIEERETGRRGSRRETASCWLVRGKRQQGASPFSSLPGWFQVRIMLSLSKREVLARTTFAEHHDSVVTILAKQREPPTKLFAIGSGFIIRSSGSRCLVMTCRHVFRQFDPAKHTMHARLSGEFLELDDEVLRLDDARNLMLIRVMGMPRAYRALEFCDSSNVPVHSDVILLAFFSTYPNIFNFGEGPQESFVFLDPGVLPGNISEPPQETNGVVHHTYIGTSGCFGGPLIFDGRVIGVNNGIKPRTRTGLAASTETVNAAMKDWLQIPPGVTKTIGEMVQSLPI